MAVSACLVGFPCAYDGGHRRVEAAVGLLRRSGGVAVCPEQLGGLPVPRVPSEIHGGSGADVVDGTAGVMTASGEDWTERFLAGGRLSLAAARARGCRWAVLKDGSPSCGVGRVYDGTFTGTARSGRGVAAEILARGGIALVDPRSLPGWREESEGRRVNEDHSDRR